MTPLPYKCAPLQLMLSTIHALSAFGTPSTLAPSHNHRDQRARVSTDRSALHKSSPTDTPVALTAVPAPDTPQGK